MPWRPEDLIGKTIANVRTQFGERYMDSADGKGYRPQSLYAESGWRISFTDGTAILISSSYAESRDELVELELESPDHTPRLHQLP